MKKVILPVVVAGMIVIGVSIYHFTVNKVDIKTDIDKLLQPYQEVIDKINAESDSDIDLVFPEENKERIYAAYKDMSISEFEETMREERDTVLREYEKAGAVLYIDATKGSGNEIYYDENHNRIELPAENPESDKEYDKTEKKTNYMKTPRIAEALNDLDRDLIAAAEAYSPSKPKSIWLRTAGIAACFCVLLLIAVFCFDKIKSKSNTTEFCIRAEVIEVTDSGQYQMKVLEEDDHFAKGSLVTIRAASDKEAQDGEGGNIVSIKSEFQYERRNAVYEALQPGDVIAVTYTDYVNQDHVSEITPENIEMIRLATEGAEKQ